MALERRFDVELMARNYSGSLNLTARGLGTFDAGAWRGPRLLVPVTVEALVVTPENASGPWAQTKVEPVVPEGGGAVTMKVPQPFETFDNRPPGVHLHWALPDGLTKGTHDTPPEEEPPQATEVGGVERREADTNQATKFPLVPDRWLVVRLSPGRSVETKRRATAWVIESEQTDEARRVTPLGEWAEDRSAGNKKERWLTAVGTGEPAYAAYYDNVQNVLGFHDSLAGVAAGPLTYVVMGWYSQPEDDPLHPPQTSVAWSALLDRLGWTLGDTPESSMERLTQVAQEAKARAGKAGLRTNYAASAATRFTLADSAVERLAKTADAPATAVRTSARALLNKTETTESRSLFLDSALSALAEISDSSVVSESNLFLQYWPRQMICHGMVYDVRWNKVGGSYDRSDSGVPRSGSIGVAVGNTGIEALSALTAERRGEVNLEKILAAFHYGLLPELDKADGLAALETLLHGEDFGSKPGGYIVDTIEEGDLFPQAATSEAGAGQAGRAAKKDSRFGGGARFEGVGQYGIPTSRVEKRFVVSKRGFNEVLADHAHSVTPTAGERAEQRPRKAVPLRRGMPRYWYPNDPVILLNQGKRSYKHGEDGRFTQDNKLVCRLTGETIQSLNPIIARASGGGAVRATITAADLAADTLDSGQIPEEARALYREALLLDETSAPVAGTSLNDKQNYLDSITVQSAATRHSLSTDSVAEKVRVEQTLLWNHVVNPDVDAQALMAISGIEGRMPSKVAVEPWSAPWTPLHLDWEVEWLPSPNTVADWELRELDYELSPRVETTASGATRSYQARSLLTPGVAAVFSARLKKFLEDEPKGDDGQATATQEEALKEIIDALGQIDVLSTSMSNFHGLLIGREERHQVTPEGADEAAPLPTPTPADPSTLFPTRAGHLRLKRLRIIDAFGQMYDFDRGALSQLTCAEDVRVETDRSLVSLPPRIVQPSRLMFRLLSAGSDAEEATKLKSPVCGWILPDHLDEALEVYDAGGISQGQVQLERDGSTLEWQGVPGNQGPLGGLPGLENQHLQRMMEGLLAWGLRDAPAPDPEAPGRESALSSLLRMIDATLWTIDPLGREGDEHLSVLVGRPLAVVRAQLALETEDAPVTEELSRTPFAVRLGALTRLHDGLMGYFVNDDYSQFYPVHESIADQTRPSGPREGFLGAIRTVPRFYQSFGGSSSVKPVEHPYINRDPLVRIRPRQQILLTLVIDPRGAVHATSGILPRKRIELMREHVADALDAMTMTFRVGPVLTDPETIRMPLPAEIRGGWSWIRRRSATVWQESPIVNANQDALLSPTPVQIAEGWLKLSGALKDNDEE